MANHKQALKRHRQSVKRQARNKHLNTIMKNTVKKVETALESKDDKEIKASLSKAESVIQHVASKGVIPKKRAARKVSRLARQASTS